MTPATDSLEFKRIFECAPALLLLVGTDTEFTILDASDACLRAIFTQRQEIVGRGLFDVFPDIPAEVGALRKSRCELRERADELRASNQVPVGREQRMIELKREINELGHQRGSPPRHAIESEELSRE